MATVTGANQDKIKARKSVPQERKAGKISKHL